MKPSRALALALALPALASARQAAEPTTLQLPRASSPIRVDAVLDEEAWRSALEIELAYEIQPGENVPAPVRTTCLLIHDTHALYAAFRAYDPEPGAVRAHLTDRDRPYRDDFVGLFLDTFNDQRRGFELFVNPLGVQIDIARNEVGSDDPEDSSWDAIWDAAGRLTPEGYVVEMAIPFSSLRFPHGTGEQTWGVAPFRAYPRVVRHQIMAHPVRRDDNCFMCSFLKVRGFEGIEPGRDVELDPTVTASRAEAAQGPGRGLGPADDDAEAGLSARWGLTPSLSLNAAVNPDFSQVEADSAQLDVNTRFALFYEEKRPLFLEGKDYFATPLEVLYTRAIADPSWGVKLTGKPGPQAIGVIVARDRTTNLLLPGPHGSEEATLDQPATAGVVRYRRDLGESSTLGVMLTTRSGDDYSNHLLGFDGVLRLSETDRVDFQLLGARSRYPSALAAELGQEEGDLDGTAFRAAYEHEARSWAAWAWGESISDDFRADLGFVPRVGARQAEVGAQRVWYGERGAFFNRAELALETTRIETQDGALLEEESELSAHFDGPFQSTIRLSLTDGRESYRERTYELTGGELFFNIRPSGAFTTSFEVEAGDAIDYDNARPARQLRLQPGFTLDLGRHLAIVFDHVFEELEVDQGRLYRANLSQLRVVYQFTVRTFVRAIVQHLDLDRSPALYQEPVGAERRTLLGQLLLSYKVNPQTVVFLGYGEDRAGGGQVSLEPTGRTVFLKVGYAWLL